MAGLFALIVGWLTGGSVELMAYALCGSLVGALKLRRGERLASFAWAAGYVTAANLWWSPAFAWRPGSGIVRGLAELGAAAFANGLITITVTLLGIYLVGVLFGVTTPLQLLEISRPTHPLLRQLLLKAPGTYHHTLIVSNMAERAAEAIGADALLTRVGAYYHDVGKTIRPYFFIENRIETLDPHARLDPYTSAQIIISHVRDGIDLARKYRLPQRVIDFIPEHQGTLLVAYFYHQAVKQAGSPEAVDKSPVPLSRPQAAEPRDGHHHAGGRRGSHRALQAAHHRGRDGADRGREHPEPDGGGPVGRMPADDGRSGRRSSKAFVDVLRGLHHPRIEYPPEAPVAAATAAPAEPAPAAQPSPARPAPGPSANRSCHPSAMTRAPRRRCKAQAVIRNRYAVIRSLAIELRTYAIEALGGLRPRFRCRYEPFDRTTPVADRQGAATT